MKHTIRARFGQMNLIGILIAVVIMIALAAFMIPKFAAVKSAPNAPRTPTERAYGTACSEYVSQMNSAVDMYKTDHDGGSPRSLADLQKYGITDDILKAPGCTYVMDPVTGTVTDATQGKLSPPGSSAGTGQPPSHGQRGPGGITLPPMNQPGLDPNSGNAP